jgi:hypothetical protein
VGFEGLGCFAVSASLHTGQVLLLEPHRWASALECSYSLSNKQSLEAADIHQG